MEDFLAEEGGEDSEGGSVARVTPATSVEGPDTGPWTARDKVIQSDAYSQINDCLIYLFDKKLILFFIADNSVGSCSSPQLM